jgi:hypothetical protein
MRQFRSGWDLFWTAENKEAFLTIRARKKSLAVRSLVESTLLSTPLANM